MTNVEAIERAVAVAVERFAKLDIVFANADTTPVGQTTLATFEEDRQNEPDIGIFHGAGRRAAPQ